MLSFCLVLVGIAIASAPSSSIFAITLVSSVGGGTSTPPPSPLFACHVPWRRACSVAGVIVVRKRQKGTSSSGSSCARVRRMPTARMGMGMGMGMAR